MSRRVRFLSPVSYTHLDVYKRQPKDQAYIRQLFRNKGIKEEPTYQRCTEECIW